MTIKRKILLFSNTSWNLNNFRDPLIRELKKKNFYVIALAPKDNSTNDLKKKVDRFYSLNLLIKKNYIFFFLKNLIKFYKIIKKEKPNYIFSYTIKCNIATIIISKLTNVISYINITGLGSVFLNNNFYYYLLKKIIIFFYRNHKKVIFQNLDDVKLIYGRNYKKKKFNLIPGLGIDISFFKPFIKKIDNNNINFYMISRIIEDKGVYEYFEAVKKVSLKYPEAKFHFVGRFDHENPSSISKENFFYNIKKLNIKYFDFFKDIKIILKKTDCIIHPSYREGMSRVLLEAASVGIPIVTTKVAGCKEIVKDRYNGYLCEPMNSNDLSNCIIKFIKLTIKDKLQMGKNSRKLIENKFNQKIIINKYLKLIND